MDSNAQHGFPTEMHSALQALLAQFGDAIAVQWQGHLCRMQLPDGQRVLINYNADRQQLWLAGGDQASEYLERDGCWLSISDGEVFYDDLKTLLQRMLESAKARTPPAPEGNASIPVQNYEPANPKQTGPSPIWLLLLLPLLFFGYRNLQPSNVVSTPELITDSAQLPPTQRMERPIPVPTQPACDRFAPDNGQRTFFPEAAGPGGSPVKVAFENAHDHDVLVYFTEPKSIKPIYAVFLKAKQKAALEVASGNYELLFVAGTQWCNAKSGYSDGQMVKLDHTFSVVADNPMQLSLQSKGNGALDFQVFLQDAAAGNAEAPAMQIESNGVLELRVQADGHYYADSTVDGVPIRFVIDTGATVTMLGKPAMGKVQISNCSMAKVNTANGIIDACFGTVRELRIGPHVIYNATVSLNPNSETNLLGMSVLGKFKLNSANGVMRISQ